MVGAHLLYVALSLATAPSAAAVDVPEAVHAIQQHQRDLYATVAPTVVYLAAKGRSGSGFFVSANGLILTNAHVVGDAEIVDVVLLDGSSHKGRVIERGSKDVDLALVQIKAKGVHYLPVVGGRPPGPGDFAASVGHGEGAVWTFNVGTVSNAYQDRNKNRILQTQIPLNPGNSGGPLVDASGRVIGVVTAGVTRANAINFAIPIELAPRVLPALAKHCQCIVVRAPKKAPIFLDGNMVGQGPSCALLPDGDDHEVFAVIQGKMKKASYTGLQRQEIRLE